MNSGIVCAVATSPEDVALHHLLRHATFVAEQGIFAHTDVDAHDLEETTVKVLARSADGEPAGAVRLRPLGDGRWQGDRLAVLPRFRAYAGRPLVRCAVALAAAAGGEEMVAYVQPANTRFFERLGWACEGGTVVYAGLDHQPMSIPLALALPLQRICDA